MLRNRFRIAAQSLSNRCAIALESLRNRFRIAAQSLSNRFAIEVKSLRNSSNGQKSAIPKVCSSAYPACLPQSEALGRSRMYGIVL
jgi:hypothetical protein